jgi:hypothetical protein
MHRADVACWIMQQRQWSKWSTIARNIRQAHRRCAGHNCFSAVIFGLPFLGQTWQKASWGSARRSGRLSGRLTRNISLASIRLTRRSVLRSRLGNLIRCNCAGCPSAETARTGLPQRFQGAKLRSPTAVETLRGRKDFYHGRSRIVMRIKCRENKGWFNGHGSSTTGTGKMAKGEIQTQTGKNREKSGT